MALDGIEAIKFKIMAEEKTNIINQENYAKLRQKALDQKTKFEQILRDFAARNQEKIQKDPKFRSDFNKMCLQIGVDPLQSRGGFWSQFLRIGDFYQELSIKTIEISSRLKHENGGMIPLDKLIAAIQKTYSHPPKISSSDIKQAIKGLNQLGQGYAVTKNGKKEYFIVDMIVDDDRSLIIDKANDNGIITLDSLQSLGFSEQRLNQAISSLYKRGIIWKDIDLSGKIQYFVFSLFKDFQ